MTSPWRAARRTTAEVLTRETMHAQAGFVRNSDTGNITGTEQVVLTVPTTELLSPSTYLIEMWARLSGATAGDRFLFIIRENSISGTALAACSDTVPESNIASAPKVVLLFDRVEVSVPTTKTYVVTCQRISGSGNGRVQAGSFAYLRRIGPNGVLTT